MPQRVERCVSALGTFKKSPEAPAVWSGGVVGEEVGSWDAATVALGVASPAKSWIHPWLHISHYYIVI